MHVPQRPADPLPRVGWLRRYGPVSLIVIAIVAAGIVATVRETGTAAQVSGVNPGQAASTAIPPTYTFAARQRRIADYHWAPGCDRATGRLKMPTVYALPCVPVFSGSNGGSTWNGVSEKTINVVYYLGAPGGSAVAALGVAGKQAERESAARAYVTMLNHITGMYGRRVNLIPYSATGSNDDAVAAEADAVTVAQSLHAFASIGGPLQTPAYADELARLHVLCIGCVLSANYADFQRDAPYLWAQTPSADTLLNTAFSYVIDQLNGKDAVWAGDPAFRHQRRLFAVVNYVQNPPQSSALATQLRDRILAARIPFAAQPLTYQLDLTTLTDQAATIAAKLKASGATTVIFAGDPIMPIYLTRECASIGYFPEWVITATAFTDTTALGRYYDQAEWAHAFGISSLPVPTTVQASDAYRLFHWWYGSQVTPPNPAIAELVLPSLMQLFEGIELAGPHLTPSSFATGMFRAPPAGGGPATPLEAYGFQGAAPKPSYTSPADYTFIWYDPTAKGQDEQGVHGTGMIRYVDGGQRYPAGTVPSTQIPMFSPADAVTGYPAPPDGSRPPSYPPWPGSPAASR